MAAAGMDIGLDPVVLGVVVFACLDACDGGFARDADRFLCGGVEWHSPASPRPGGIAAAAENMSGSAMYWADPAGPPAILAAPPLHA